LTAGKRSTGIVGLDLALSGGFPTGMTAIIIGSPLSGIEHLPVQFWNAEGKKGTYLMLDGLPEEGMIEAAGMTPEEIASFFNTERVVVDSLSSLILAHGIEAGLNLIRTARDRARKDGSNILFILYESTHPPIDEIRLQRSADIFIELRTSVQLNEIERSLIVYKIRNHPAPRRVVPFLITEKGLELSTTSRIV
jgi:KaiC/GvpD/RAD55 family RecA-like ATPase